MNHFCSRKCCCWSCVFFIALSGFPLAWKSQLSPALPSCFLCRQLPGHPRPYVSVQELALSSDNALLSNSQQD